MNQVKVKFIKQMVGYNFVYEVGQEVLVPEKRSQNWVRAGYCEIVEQKKSRKRKASATPKGEKASKKPSEGK